MYGHRDDDDFDDWVKDLQDNINKQVFNIKHSDTRVPYNMGVITIVGIVAALVVLALVCACCCRRRRDRGVIIASPPVPPAPNNVPAPYPQQQYAPYPHPHMPPSQQSVQTAAYNPAHPAHLAAVYPPAPAPAPYPTVTPYPAATPYPATAPYPVPAAYPDARETYASGGWAGYVMPATGLPPSYDQVMGGEKQPPYNPSAPR